jgi:1-acyl-sn-glycerol-3-phosphate acyltransferase
MEGDRFVLRSITDEIMYELMQLSGQEYVDTYATKQAEDLPSEVAHIGSVNGDAQPERRSSADVLNPTGAVASGQ